MSSQLLPTLEEVLKDQKAGPGRITIEEYRQRQKSKLEEPTQEQTTKPRRLKKRAGKKVKQRKELAQLHRMAAIAVTQQEKNLCLSQIKEIHNNKKGGPEPITFEEFCKWLKSKLEEPKQEQTSKPGRLKKRGGKQAKQRKELAQLHRMAALAVNKKEKKIFLSQIKEIHKNKGGGRNQHTP